MSPLDLHVLGTPPAFVLSQDQTLAFNPLSLSGLFRSSAFTGFLASVPLNSLQELLYFFLALYSLADSISLPSNSFHTTASPPKHFHHRISAKPNPRQNDSRSSSLHSGPLMQGLLHPLTISPKLHAPVSFSRFVASLRKLDYYTHCILLRQPFFPLF